MGFRFMKISPTYFSDLRNLINYAADAARVRRQPLVRSEMNDSFELSYNFEGQDHTFRHCILGVVEDITISGLVLSTMAKSSFCSFSGTLNLSKVFSKSATMASHFFAVMYMCLWDSFIVRPLYFSGPPVA